MTEANKCHIRSKSQAATGNPPAWPSSWTRAPRATCSLTQACSEPTLVTRRLTSTFPCKQGGSTAGEPGQSPDPERVERAPTRKRSGVAFGFRHSAGTALCHLDISPSPKPIAVCRVVRKVATAKPPFAGQIAHGQWCEVASSGNMLVLIC